MLFPTEYTEYIIMTVYSIALIHFLFTMRASDISFSLLCLLSGIYTSHAEIQPGEGNCSCKDRMNTSVLSEVFSSGVRTCCLQRSDMLVSELEVSATCSIERERPCTGIIPRPERDLQVPVLNYTMQQFRKDHKSYGRQQREQYARLIGLTGV